MNTDLRMRVEELERRVAELEEAIGLDDGPEPLVNGVAESLSAQMHAMREASED